MDSIKTTTLPSGLRIVTDCVKEVESVAVGVWVGVGTRNEDLAHNGAAHMVEHMLFKGTQKRSARQISEEIENVGGHMNAYTSREITSYHIHLLKNDLPLALDVLADIIQESTMPEDEIERERGVILQEIGMCNDTPDDVIFDHYYETAYPEQSLGAPILGKSEIIQSITRDQLRAYTKTLYTPNRMVISAAGNVDHEDFVAQIIALFNALPDDQEHEKAPARYKGGSEFRLEKDLEQAHIILGYNGISRLDSNYHTAQTLGTLLGGGMSSRLFQEVREKRGLVYSIFSFHSACSDSGQFMIYAGTGPEKLPELIPVICDEIKAVSKNITPTELARAKAQLKATTLIARESMTSRADQNAKCMLTRGHVRSAEQIIELYDNVALKDVENVAQKIFSSRVTLAALGPLSQLEPFEKIQSRLQT